MAGKHRGLIVTIVYIALLLDSMLHTFIVPMIPQLLADMNQNGIELHTNASSKTYLRGTDRNTGNSSTQGINDNTSSINQEAIESFDVDLQDILGWNTAGVLIASKSIVELFTNCFVGPIIDRTGYECSLMVGLMILFFSTAGFAFGQSYESMVAARCLQGFGSGVAQLAAYATLAHHFKDASDATRTRILGVSTVVATIGYLLAPSCGGALHQYTGKVAAFSVLSAVALGDVVLLLASWRPLQVPWRQQSLTKQEEPAELISGLINGKQLDVKKRRTTSCLKVATDPYIIISALTVVVADLNMSFLEPTLAKWMRASMETEEWVIGCVWLPTIIPYIIGVCFAVRLRDVMQSRTWLIIIVGLLTISVGSFLLPFAISVPRVAVLLMLNCFGIALVLTTALPMLTYVAEARHFANYATVYCVADVCFNLAFSLGPILADWVYTTWGFLVVGVIASLTCASYVPFAVLLRFVYQKDNMKEADAEDDCEQYVVSTDEDEFD